MRSDVYLNIKKRLFKPTFILIGSIALAACGSDDETPEPRRIEIEDISVSVNEDTPLASSVFQDVGDDIVYRVSRLPENGTLEMQVNGEFSYTPSSNFNGNDSFDYIAVDGDLPSNIASVDIVVNPVNDEPTASDAELLVIGVQGASITLQAEDVEGDALEYSLLSESSLASISLTSTGELTYTANQAFSGEEQVEFLVSDGELSTTGVVNVEASISGVRFPSLVSEFSIEQRSHESFSFPIQNLTSSEVDLIIDSTPSWLVGSVNTLPANGTGAFYFNVASASLDVGAYSGVVQFSEYGSGVSHSHFVVLQVTSDITPPSAVGTLSVSLGELYDEADVSWTSVDDNARADLSAGEYDLRYFTEELTEDNWAVATQVDGEPTAALPGGQEFLAISGLPESTTLHFAIKVLDPSGNESAISNIASLTTLAAPQPTLDPASASISLPEGSTTELAITLRNTGESPLAYDAQVHFPEPLGSVNALTIKSAGEVKRKVPTFTAKDISLSSGNIIVKRKSNNGSALVVGGAIKSKNLKIKKTFNKLNVDVVSSKGKSNSEIADDINYLNSLPDVLYAEPDYLVYASAIPNDARFTEQWAVNNEGQTGGTFDADIDALETWDRYRDGSNVVVAVIDTGVNYNHEDLASNMWVNQGEIPGNGVDDDENGFIDDVHGYDFVNDDGDPMDDHDHGTHCSGIIAAQGDNGVGIAGTAHQAKIMAVKFLSASGGGSSEAAIESILYAVDNGATILSNSWGGGGFSQALEDAITYANDNDVLFIAAAGNSSRNTDVSANYPSGYDVENVIAVASTNHTDGISYFSNYGLTTVDLGAPGSDILSTVSNGGYASFSGTSMATPYVAGAAVLVRSYFPDLTSSEVKQILMETVDPIAALNGKTVTGGRLNLNAVMDLAQERGRSPFVQILDYASGVIPAGSEVVIPVAVDATGQTIGMHSVDIIFEVNNPEEPELTFDLNIEVTPDGEPPSAISDLAIDSITSESVAVNWTNTGDDGLVGNAEEVQIAYSIEPINSENWDEAPKLEGISPNDSGESQQITIDGLSRNTLYYFAAKVIDNSENSSPLSNVESASTLIGPVLDLFPLAFDPVVLTQGDSAELELELSNIGDEVLTYQILATQVEGAEPTVQKANPDALNFSVNIEKGEEDLSLGQPVVQGSGGPDAFGYSWTDSDEGGTTYDWQDIAALGTPMTFSDDSVRGPISLGFDFEFYGETYNQVWVSSNGFISFNASVSNGCCSGRPIPSADGFENIIAWAWADLYPIAGYSAYSFSDAGQFTIQFTNYGEYADSGVVSAQIILNSNGRIKLQYQSVDTGFGLNDASIGIENADGTDGLQVAFNTDYLHDELAIEFSNGPQWLALSPASGEIEADSLGRVAVTLDSTDQLGGTYEAELLLQTNDVAQPEIIIPLRMDVVLPVPE